MSDKLPSLFDFDDESLFPKPEERPKTPVEEKPVAEAKSVPEEDSANGITIAGGALDVDERGHLENSPDEEAKIQESDTKEISPGVYSRPKLELPGHHEAQDPDNAPDAQAFDKQIGSSSYQPKDTAFTFEPRKDSSAETVPFPEGEQQDRKDAEPAVVPELKSEAENGKENMPVQEMIIEPLPEWSLDKNYYTIGEVAQLFEVNVSHIRFWTTEFKMRTRTTRKGDRLYTPAQIAELRLIHHLVKVRKYTLKGAKEILKSGNVQLEKKLNLKEELQKLYQELSDLKDSL